MAERSPEEISEVLNETADLIEELPESWHRLATELRVLGDLVAEQE